MLWSRGLCIDGGDLFVDAGPGGNPQEINTFGTLTTDLLVLYYWLQAKEVTHVLMESTGIFWKSTYNLLEDKFQVLLVNAANIKRVSAYRGRLSDQMIRNHLRNMN